MTSAPDLTPFEWSRDRWADALRALAHAIPGTSVDASIGTPSPSGETDPGDDAAARFAQALPDRARAVGLDVEAIDIPPVDPLATIRRVAPMLITDLGRGGFMIVSRLRGKTAILMGPKGAIRVANTVIEDALWARSEREPEAKAEANAEGRIQSARDQNLANLFAGMGSIPPRRRRAACRALLAPSLAGRPLAEGWVVRPIMTGMTGMKGGLRAAKMYRRFAGVIAAHLAQFALFLAIWSQVGTQVFADGDLSTASAQAPGSGGFPVGFAPGFTVGFLTLLGLWVVVQLAASAAVSRLGLDVGAVVRGGLMRGALRLDPGRIRTAGVGQLLGCALDAEVLDALALGGGIEATAGIFELLLGIGILAVGATPAWSLAMSALALAGLAAGAHLHARRLAGWCRTRRALTHDLVERMMGHRTALIQDRPPRRAAADAAALHTYDVETRALDQAEVWLSVGLPRGWLLGGLLALAPLGFSAGGVSASSIALSLAAVWLVYGAFRRLGVAVPMLSLAREAWGQISPLVGATESDPLDAAAFPSTIPGVVAGADPTAPLIDVDNVVYRYPDRPSRVLDGVSLKVVAGDRVLVEGASGGGKSTLAGLLTGLKTPEAGQLRLRGRDQRSIGLVRWRRAVGGAPQFHDNHVIGAELLFNLLMGRRWPPRIEDIAAAERVCLDLGLGPLLGRMPGGIMQMVGETGWQLSHGERSRLFIARSLLQNLDARVLDESFAALDPETLDEVLAAVLSRPEALIVIAHP